MFYDRVYFVNHYKFHIVANFPKAYVEYGPFQQNLKWQNRIQQTILHWFNVVLNLSPPVFFLLTVRRMYFFCGLFFICICLLHIVLSVSYNLLITYWKRADLLALLYVTLCCVSATFPDSVLGQVWYLIVSIPGGCLLPYVYEKQ